MQLRVETDSNFFLTNNETGDELTVLLDYPLAAISFLLATGRAGYPYILLIDGNDPRGIDVAIMSRHPIMDISTHIFDIPGAPPIFALN